MSELNIYLAPIQGITDYIFRNTFIECFQGLNRTFTPFIRFQNNFEIKKSQLTDIKAENNNLNAVVPQVLTNKSSEIIYLASLANDLGYSEINWNLGCPFPMVVNRKMGAGLLPNAETIDKILDEVFKEIKIHLSVKMRIGFENSNDIFQVLELLNKYPVSEIIIHPRLGKQMYSGTVNLDVFEKCLLESKHIICYNGDINNFNDFVRLKEKFAGVNNWMIGRGAISNPFLIENIYNSGKLENEDKLERFSEFHFRLFERYESILSGPGHLIDKMLKFWEYFSKSFEDPHKVLKLIKKSKTIVKYKQAIYEIFNNVHYTG
jgi:tRNA-dihydrouridine synthase B